MLISTQQELRILIPSHAVDNVEIFQGIIDNSEKDLLKEKLGAPLYDALCNHYNDLDPQDYFDSVVDGSYAKDPWSELLLNAQRIIVNDALARFAYQQVISINGTGVNVVSGNDYGNADDRLLERGVSGYRKEAAIAVNNLLTLLEAWAKEPVSSADAPGAAEEGASEFSSEEAKGEIISLWQQSRYYYLHASLLIPSCSTLQPYFNVYENRDKFIQMLPDLHYIQEELVAPTIGEDFTEALAALSLKGTDVKPLQRIIKKIRSAIAAELESRTKVISTDKDRRQLRHDEFVHLLDNACKLIQKHQSVIMGATVPDVSPSGIAEAFKESPLFTPEEETDQRTYTPTFQNNATGNVLFALPGIN